MANEVLELGFENFGEVGEMSEEINFAWSCLRNENNNGWKIRIDAAKNG